MYTGSIRLLPTILLAHLGLPKYLKRTIGWGEICQLCSCIGETYQNHVLQWYYFVAELHLLKDTIKSA